MRFRSPHISLQGLRNMVLLRFFVTGWWLYWMCMVRRGAGRLSQNGWCAACRTRACTTARNVQGTNGVLRSQLVYGYESS